MGRKIIGLTGAFGSGSSFLAKHFFEQKGYKRCSLSDALRERYKEENGGAVQDKRSRHGDPVLAGRRLLGYRIVTAIRQ